MVHIWLLQGYKQKKAYIIAENPMDITVPDMLTVLYSAKIGAVVMLSSIEENGMVIIIMNYHE